MPSITKPVLREGRSALAEELRDIIKALRGEVVIDLRSDEPTVTYVPAARVERAQSGSGQDRVLGSSDPPSPVLPRPPRLDRPVRLRRMRRTVVLMAAILCLLPASFNVATTPDPAGRGGRDLAELQPSDVARDRVTAVAGRVTATRAVTGYPHRQVVITAPRTGGPPQ